LAEGFDIGVVFSDPVFSGIGGILIGLIIGFIIGFLIAFFRYYWRYRHQIATFAPKSS